MGLNVVGFGLGAVFHRLDEKGKVAIIIDNELPPQVTKTGV